MAVVIGGIYEHYKQKRYKVIGVAYHSETLEKLVVYKALYGDEKLWVRPYEMFCEKVIHDGALVDRFSFLGDDLLNSIEIELDIPPSIKNELFENKVDINAELKNEINDLQFYNKYSSDGKKDAVGIIIASGLALSAVILCITRLIRAVSERPRFFEIQKYDLNNNLLKRDVIMIEPSKSSQKTSIDFELGTKYVKLHMDDESSDTTI